MLNSIIDDWNKVQLPTTILRTLGRPYGDTDDETRLWGSQTAQGCRDKIFMTQVTLPISDVLRRSGLSPFIPSPRLSRR